jgi:hypothetical protein
VEGGMVVGDTLSFLILIFRIALVE